MTPLYVLPNGDGIDVSTIVAIRVRPTEVGTFNTLGQRLIIEYRSTSLDGSPNMQRTEIDFDTFSNACTVRDKIIAERNAVAYFRR